MRPKTSGKIGGMSSVDQKISRNIPLTTVVNTQRRKSLKWPSPNFMVSEGGSAIIFQTPAHFLHDVALVKFSSMTSQESINKIRHLNLMGTGSHWGRVVGTQNTHWHCDAVCNTPFTRYNQLSNQFDNRLSNQFDNRLSNQFDNRVERTATVRSTGCQTRFDNLVEGTAVRSTGCQTGLYNQFDNRLYTRYSRLSNRLSNPRLNVCIHDTTGCIVYTNI